MILTVGRNSPLYRSSCVEFHNLSVCLQSLKSKRLTKGTCLGNMWQIWHAADQKLSLNATSGMYNTEDTNRISRDSGRALKAYANVELGIELVSILPQVAFEAQAQTEASPETIADSIYQYAMKQRSRDDVCVIVLSLCTELASSIQE